VVLTAINNTPGATGGCGGVARVAQTPKQSPRATGAPRVEPTPLPNFGDFNGDGTRDAADFAAWLAARSREMPMARAPMVSPGKSADSGQPAPRASVEKRGAK
jgi:hypothetical protein